MVMDAHLIIVAHALQQDARGGADIIPLPVATELKNRDFNTTDVDSSEIFIDAMEQLNLTILNMPQLATIKRATILIHSRFEKLPK